MPGNMCQKRSDRVSATLNHAVVAHSILVSSLIENCGLVYAEKQDMILFHGESAAKRRSM